MFLGTPLYGVVQAGWGFAACALLSAAFVLPAVIDGLIRRRA
jgi:hypothetical protein